MISDSRMRAHTRWRTNERQKADNTKAIIFLSIHKLAKASYGLSSSERKVKVARPVEWERTACKDHAFYCCFLPSISLSFSYSCFRSRSPSVLDRIAFVAAILVLILVPCVCFFAHSFFSFSCVLVVVFFFSSYSPLPSCVPYTRLLTLHTSLLPYVCIICCLYLSVDLWLKCWAIRFLCTVWQSVSFFDFVVPRRSKNRYVSHRPVLHTHTYKLDPWPQSST